MKNNKNSPAYNYVDKHMARIRRLDRIFIVMWYFIIIIALGCWVGSLIKGLSYLLS